MTTTPQEPLRLSPAADALCDMLSRLGGDGTCTALNYDGDDTKVADELYQFVQWLEARGRCEALWKVCKALGMPDEVARAVDDAARASIAGEKDAECRYRSIILQLAKRK